MRTCLLIVGAALIVAVAAPSAQSPSANAAGASDLAPPAAGRCGTARTDLPDGAAARELGSMAHGPSLPAAVDAIAVPVPRDPNPRTPAP